MRNFLTRFISTIAVCGLVAIPAWTEEGDFWAFLEDTWEDIQSDEKPSNANSGYTGASLENEIVVSAQARGESDASAEHYAEYAAKLARTLNKLSPEQQARVFKGE
jgi:hypothetical protein